MKQKTLSLFLFLLDQRTNGKIVDLRKRLQDAILTSRGSSSELGASSQTVSIFLGYEYQCIVGDGNVYGVVVGIVKTRYLGTKKKCLTVSSTTNRDSAAEITILMPSGWCRLKASQCNRLMGKRMDLFRERI